VRDALIDGMRRAARDMFWMRVASAGILPCRCVQGRMSRSVEFTGYALRLLLHACAGQGSVAFLACGLSFASASLLALDSQFNGAIGAPIGSSASQRPRATWRLNQHITNSRNGQLQVPLIGSSSTNRIRVVEGGPM
jgi:hypothetical protein